MFLSDQYVTQDMTHRTMFYQLPSMLCPQITEGIHFKIPFMGSNALIYFNVGKMSSMVGTYYIIDHKCSHDFFNHKTNKIFSMQAFKITDISQQLTNKTQKNGPQFSESLTEVSSKWKNGESSKKHLTDSKTAYLIQIPSPILINIHRIVSPKYPI